MASGDDEKKVRKLAEDLLTAMLQSGAYEGTPANTLGDYALALAYRVLTGTVPPP